MRILAIETSCDDTSISLIEGDPLKSPLSFSVHAHVTASQKIHANYGGVFPAKAKEAHMANIVPTIREALRGFKPIGADGEFLYSETLAKIFVREPVLIPDVELLLRDYPIPPIDAIAVTYGPGLEMCLWVGINVARALGTIWNIPVIPVNHMEGHALSALFERVRPKSPQAILKPLQYPALSLLISGGHTQLVLLKAPLRYEVIGNTVDDAVGEAYDKVARMMDLPYPGGPHISAHADRYREAFQNRDSLLKNLFPRPMLHTPDYNFSFSGLKTAVMYHIRDMGGRLLTDTDKERLSYAFESSVSEVLAEKTRRALQYYNAASLLLGGGVACNRHLRRKFFHVTNDEQVELFLPEIEITTDNALMIALVAFYRLSMLPMHECAVSPDAIKASPTVSIADPALFDTKI